MEEFHSIQISAGPFSVADNVAICYIEMLQSFGRSFKPITRRSWSVLSIAFVFVVSVPVQGILPVFSCVLFYEEAPFMITPPFILRQQDTKQDQSSVKFCAGDRVSVTKTCCDFHLGHLGVFFNRLPKEKESMKLSLDLKHSLF